MTDSKHQGFPFGFFGAFKWMYLVFGAVIVVSGVLNLISASAIKARKHRTFSLIVAGLNCVHIPLGILLGIFTIIVLMRESVIQIYESNAPAESQP